MLTGHKAKQVLVENGENPRLRACRPEVRLPFDQILVAVAHGERHRLRAWRSWASGPPEQDHRDQRLSADDLPEHLRLRRRRPVPVHAHGIAPGLVRGGQYRCSGDSRNSAPITARHSLATFTGPRGRTRGGCPNRAKEKNIARGHGLRHRRPRPRDRRRRGTYRLPLSARSRAACGHHQRRHHRWRTRGRRFWSSLAAMKHGLLNKILRPSITWDHGRG